MFAKLAVILLLIAAPVLAQDSIPDTLALSDEDAQACKVKACKTITEGAYERVLDAIESAEQRAAKAEARVKKLEAALERKPKYCI